MQAIGMISEENLIEVNNWLQVMPLQSDKKNIEFRANPPVS